MRHTWLGRNHESVFEDSCIDRYQLALDMLITAKSSSRFSVCSSFHAVVQASDTPVDVEQH